MGEQALANARVNAPNVSTYSLYLPHAKCFTSLVHSAERKRCREKRRMIVQTQNAHKNETVSLFNCVVLTQYSYTVLNDNALFLRIRTKCTVIALIKRYAFCLYSKGGIDSKIDSCSW